MRLFFKIVSIYTLIATMFAILLGIYNVFAYSMLVGFFFVGLYIFAIVSVVICLIKFVDQLKEKIKPIIKFLEKFSKWFPKVKV